MCGRGEARRGATFAASAGVSRGNAAIGAAQQRANGAGKHTAGETGKHTGGATAIFANFRLASRPPIC